MQKCNSYDSDFELLVKQTKVDTNLFRERIAKQVKLIAETNSVQNILIRSYLPSQLELLSKTIDSIVTKKQNGPLFGLSFVVKDVFQLKETSISMGLESNCGNFSSANAELVQKFIDLGATLIGSSNMDPLGLSMYGENPFYGQVQNPLFVERIPGGSSSGSAASLTAGFCNFSLGSDHGGSVRVPAACCGVVGFKPSSKFFARDNIALISEMDVPGIFTPSVKALRQLLKNFDFNSDVRSIKTIFIPCPEEKSGLDSFVQSKYEQCIHELSTRYEICHLDFKLGFDNANELRKKIIARDFFTFCKKYELVIPSKLRAALALHSLGESIGNLEYQSLIEEQSNLRTQVLAYIGEAGALFVPTIPSVPPSWKALELLKVDSRARTSLNYYLSLANLCDLPAIALPLFEDAGEWPFSVQLIAQQEASLLELTSSFGCG